MVVKIQSSIDYDYEDEDREREWEDYTVGNSYEDVLHQFLIDLNQRDAIQETFRVIEIN